MRHNPDVTELTDCEPKRYLWLSKLARKALRLPSAIDLNTLEGAAALGTAVGLGQRAEHESHHCSLAEVKAAYRFNGPARVEAIRDLATWIACIRGARRERRKRVETLGERLRAYRRKFLVEEYGYYPFRHCTQGHKVVVEFVETRAEVGVKCEVSRIGAYSRRCTYPKMSSVHILHIMRDWRQTVLLRGLARSGPGLTLWASPAVDLGRGAVGYVLRVAVQGRGTALETEDYVMVDAGPRQCYAPESVRGPQSTWRRVECKAREGQEEWNRGILGRVCDVALRTAEERRNNQRGGGQ
jgi:hypothetical protein